MKQEERFEHLMSLANGGDENAIGDLWREFGFKYQQAGELNDAD